MEHEARMYGNLQSVPECSIPFVELNPDSPITVVLIHGAQCSPLEWSLVTPHLSQYHLLVPAYHLDSQTQTLQASFSMNDTAARIADLIQKRAKNGQAHIFGFSLGSFIVLNLALQRPETVLSVIASGITLFSRFPGWKAALVPAALYAQSPLPRLLLPRGWQIALFNRVVKPASDDIATKLAAAPMPGSWTLSSAIAKQLGEALPPGKPIPVRHRVLIVAATSSKTAAPDPLEDAKIVLEEVQKHNSESRGVEVEQGAHPWMMQLPQLCADMIHAWIISGPFPDGTKEIFLQRDQ